ncbi:MAG: hypothetical protein ABSG42_08470 [Nitrospirota bacterium]
MPFDAVVMDGDFQFIGQLRVPESVHVALFRKLVTGEEYPSLGKLRKDDNDISFSKEELPGLVSDIGKLRDYLENENMMSAEVKEKCLDFIRRLGELAAAAVERGRSLDFVAGD